ncbi:MAG: hypothetical protein KKH52_03820 [Nanoarchaeota archaeon]|nr:hypothetical protein [Nanoarchaeota archaeon]
MKKTILINLLILLSLSFVVHGLEAIRTIEGSSVSLSFTDLGQTNELTETVSGGATIVEGSYPADCQLNFGTTLVCGFASSVTLISYETSGTGSVSGILTSYSPPTTLNEFVITESTIGVCTPSCTGKVCGDDGCGGSCGTCPADYTCSAGACVAEDSDKEIFLNQMEDYYDEGESSGWTLSLFSQIAEFFRGLFTS